MPEAHLIFKLPEEGREFELASKAELLLGLIDDLDQELRSFLKYGTPPFDHQSAPESPEAIAERLRTWIANELVVRGIPDQ